MRKGSVALREEFRELQEEAEAIIDKAEAENREVTDQELKRCKKLTDSLIPAKAEELNQAEERERTKALVGAMRFGSEIDGNGSADNSRSKAPRLRDAQGREILNLGREDSFRDAVGGSERVENGFGEMVRCMLTGRQDFVQDAVRNAMATTPGSAGGYLIPTPLWSEVVDKARSLMVLDAAGMRVIPMDATTLDISTIETDPVMEVKAENALFTETSIVFGRKQLKPYLVGCFILASRELAEDSPNFSSVLTDTMAQVLAVTVDGLGLTGTGTGQPTGIQVDTDVPETGTAGAITWAQYIDSVTKVWEANHRPAATITHPTLHSAVLASTDTQNRWLGAPPHMDGVSMLQTTGSDSGKIITGDFSKFAMGMRTSAMIETSTEAGEAFQRHQVAYKITTRIDFVTLDPSAFHRRAGVTAA